MKYEVKYYVMPVGSNAWQEFANIRIPDANESNFVKFTARLINDGADVYETEEAIVYHIYPIPRHMTKFIFYK